MTPSKTVQTTESPYEVFRDERRRLLQLLDRFGKVASELELEKTTSAIEETHERLRSDRFRILVLGDFNTGKSTFINALLGRSLLPQDALPCTAVLSELVWGDPEKARLTFKDPRPHRLPKSISEEALKHINTHKDPVPPMTGMPEVIARRVTASEEDLRPRADVVSPYSSAKFWLHHDLLRNDIELIDSPGLDNHEAHTTITVDHLNQVDSVLFLTSALAPFGQGEETFVKRYIAKVGRRYCFFLCNRFDQLNSDRERESVRRRLETKLGRYTDLEPGVFCLSAYQALEGRTRGNPSLLQSSGIEELEEALHRFLARDRGKVKLLEPLGGLKALIDEIFSNRTIDEQLENLDVSLAELEVAHREQEPKIEHARSRLKFLLSEIELGRKLLAQNLQDRAEGILHELIEELPSWLEDMEFESELSLLWWERQEAIETFANEVETKLREKFEEGFSERAQSVMAPELELGMIKIQTNAQTALKNLEEDLGKIRPLKAGGAELPETGEGATQAEDSGVFLEFLGTAVLAAGGTVAALASAWIVLPALAVAGLLGFGLRLDHLRDRTQGEVVKGLQKRYKNGSREVANAVASHMLRPLEGFQKQVGEAVERRIDALESGLQSSLETKRKGENEVQAKRIRLQQLAREMSEISDRAQSLEMEIQTR